MGRPRFHRAFPLESLDDARGLYVDVLGAREGRPASRWVELDLWGHQLSAHLVGVGHGEAVHTNGVDGDAVPVGHFGCILSWGAGSSSLRG